MDGHVADGGGGGRQLRGVRVRAAHPERLNAFGVLGCVLCIVGSTTLVLHAPPEQEVGSITEMLALAMRPAFLVYAAAAGAAVVWLVWRVAPKVSGALRLPAPPTPAGPPVCPSRWGA